MVWRRRIAATVPSPLLRQVRRRSAQAIRYGQIVCTTRQVCDLGSAQSCEFRLPAETRKRFADIVCPLFLIGTQQVGLIGA
jgi:hypothetical protein